MKNKIWIVISLVLLAAAILFACLWLHERNDRSDLKEAAQFEASASYADFVQYTQTGSEASYRQAVASFYAYEQSYYRCVEGTNKESNYLAANQMYGYLLLSPEKCQEHIAEIEEALALLSASIEDENAYLKMAHVVNILSE